MKLNRIVVELVEGTGAPLHQCAGARQVVLCKSVKRGLAYARLLANQQIDKSWEERGIPAGQCPVLDMVEINGKILHF